MVLVMRPSLARRALSSILPGLMVATAIVALTVFSIYLLSSSVATFAQLIKSSRRVEQIVAVNSIAVYSNGSMAALIANVGSSTIERVSELDILISIDLSGQRISYLLRFGLQPSSGRWWVEEICIEGTTTCFPYHSHIFLKPGEVALVRGLLPAQLTQGGWGYIVVITPTGYRAERAFAVIE